MRLTFYHILTLGGEFISFLDENPVLISISRIRCLEQYNEYKQDSVLNVSTSSSVGEGGGWGERRNVPPPEIGKIVVEIWCYLPEVYILSERSQKSKKYLVKNCEKRQFSIEILIKISQNFLEIFKIIFIFGPKAQNIAGILLRFSCPLEILHHILMSMHFSTNSSRFSQKIARIFMPFSIVLLYLSYFLSFFINFSIRYQNSQRISLDLQSIIKSANL